MGRILEQINRNKVSISGEKSKKNRINLEYWNRRVNIGDTIAPVIYNWMLQQYNLNPDKEMKKTVHLLTVGSLIGMGNFDAVIWGSGFHTFGSIRSVVNKRYYRKYDIRAVRGPISAEILKISDYDCPAVYGDPAILMPRIYQPESMPKKYKYSAVLHIDHREVNIPKGVNYINVETNDYKSVINRMLESEIVISSSLHGIILAESYGIPAVFLGQNMEYETIKFYDWYYSTGRKNVLIANSLEEALQMTPMALPQLEEMQKNLMVAFPKDLWN